MFFSVFVQSRDRRFDRDRLVSPEPALVLARETLRPHPRGVRGVPAEGGLTVLDDQDAVGRGRDPDPGQVPGGICGRGVALHDGSLS